MMYASVSSEDLCTGTSESHVLLEPQDGSRYCCEEVQTVHICDLLMPCAEVS